MPSSTSRSKVRGRRCGHARPEAGGGISGSTSAHSSSLISRGGGEDAGADMRRTLPRPAGTDQNPRAYFCNVFQV